MKRGAMPGLWRRHLATLPALAGWLGFAPEPKGMLALKFKLHAKLVEGGECGYYTVATQYKIKQ
jgi:hypothetical protein